MTLSKLAKLRSLLSSVLPPLLSDISVQDQRIGGHANAPGVRLWVVNSLRGSAGANSPSAGFSRPAILHMHGGGFTAGSARGSVPHLQYIAKELDCIIVSVDFRNAPEARYKDTLEDNYTALKWLYGNAGELGVDRARIAVMGESGGGGDAVLLAIAARDRGEIALRFQALIYPMLDDRTGSSRATAPHLGYFGWNTDSNRFSWRCFLGEEPGTDAVPSHAVPSRVRSLADLPSTFIGVGTLDLFVEENESYAARLEDAGVPTELLLMPACFHGFDLLARETDIAKRFISAKSML